MTDSRGETMEGKMDSAEYGRLIEPLLDPAAGYALSIVRNRQDAEDAVQQAALQGLARIDTFDAGRIGPRPSVFLSSHA